MQYTFNFDVNILVTGLALKKMYYTIYLQALFSSDLQLPGHAGEGEPQPGQQDCDWSELRGPRPQRPEGKATEHHPDSTELKQRPMRRSV